MVHGRDWWELHPNNPPKEEMGHVRRQRNVPSSLKWRFHWCLRQQGWNCQQYWNVINHGRFYLFTPSAFCFWAENVIKHVKSADARDSFTTKRSQCHVAIAENQLIKPARIKHIFQKCFFPPRHQLLDRIWKILQGWNWNMLIGEWQQLSAGATSLCNYRLFLTTCRKTQNGHSAASDCRKHRLNRTDRTFTFLTFNCTED